VRWAAASVTKTATSLGVPTAAVPKVMMAQADHGKTSSAERNRDQQPEPSERDRHTLMRIASKDHRTAAEKMTAELNIHLEDHIHKTVQQQLTIPTTTAQLKLLNL
jgi:hypothetical protein